MTPHINQAFEYLTRGQIQKAKDILLDGLKTATKEQLPTYTCVAAEIKMAENVWALSRNDPQSYRELRTAVKAIAA